MAGKSSVSKTAALMRRLIEGGMDAEAAERAAIQRGPELLAAEEGDYIETAAAEVLKDAGLEGAEGSKPKSDQKPARDGSGDTAAERYARRASHSTAWGGDSQEPVR